METPTFKYVFKIDTIGVIEEETYQIDLKLSEGDFVQISQIVDRNSYYRITKVTKVLDYDTDMLVHILHLTEDNSIDEWL